MSDDISNIRARRQERIHYFNQFVFITEETLVSLSRRSESRCPGLDANNVAARVVIRCTSAGKVDQVAAPVRCGIEFV
jgi:hypothetical protein